MSFIHTQRVEFRDTDAAGIAHFSMFFVWMEQAEHAALRHVGLSVLPKPTDGRPIITWPRVSATCDYQSPAQFEDQLQIVVEVAKLGSKSVSYAFRFQNQERNLAAGRLTTVCCQYDLHMGLTPIAIPADIRDKLQQLHS